MERRRKEDGPVHLSALLWLSHLYGESHGKQIACKYDWLFNIEFLMSDTEHEAM